MPNQEPFTTNERTTGPGVDIRWQQGPKSGGVNGATPWDVIAAARQRLTWFQAGPAPCTENREAIEYLTAALAALDRRSADRFARGVVGQLEP